MDRRGETISLLMMLPVAVAIAAISWFLLHPPLALVSCALGLAMLGIVVADSRWFIVPDVLSLPSIFAGLLVSGRLLDPSVSTLASSDHVVGMVAGGLSFWLIREAYFRLRRQEGLGLGDVKLAAAAGAWVGWQGLANVVLLAGGLALTAVLAAAVLSNRRVLATDKLPFGCFLAPSIWIVWLLGVYARGS